MLRPTLNRVYYPRAMMACNFYRRPTSMLFKGDDGMQRQRSSDRVFTQMEMMTFHA